MKPRIHFGKDILWRLRAASRRLASGVLIMVTAVWLNMAIQPCLMAAEPMLPGEHGEAGCPHCPPAQSGHCGDENSGRCAFMDSLNFDGRQPAKLIEADDQPVAMMLPVPATTPWSAPGHRVSMHPGNPPPVTDPPLFLRNCSFLK